MKQERLSLKKLGLLGIFGAAVAGCAQQSPATLISGFTGERFVGLHSASTTSSMTSAEVNSTQVKSASSSKASSEDAAKIASRAHSYGTGEGARMVEERLDAIEPAAGPARSAHTVAKPLARTDVASVVPQTVVETKAPLAEVASETVRHKVVASDTVFKLARTYNTSANQILKDNGMKAAADIKVGQTLSITTNTKAQVSVLDDMKRVLSADVQTAHSDQAVNEIAAATPVAERMRVAVSQAEGRNLDAIEPAAGVAPTSKVEYVSHTVASKETIYRISLKYGVSVLDIMAANDFSEPQDLKADAVIRVPMKQTTPHMVAGVKDAPAVAGIEPAAGESGKPVQVAMLRNVPLGIGGGQDDLDARAAKQEAVKAEILQSESASSEVTAVKKVVEKVQDEVVAAEAQRGKVDPVAAKASGMVWPVKGQVVRRFGDDGHGVARTGINISVPKGTPVLASDTGTVLYADNGLKIYGNLVLIRHDSGMVSAYAHNGYLLVKKGEKVKKGQVVAVSGASGNVESPQLHFELRQHASAVDPMRVLPKL